MKVSRSKCQLLIGIGGFLFVYIGLYLATTTVRPQGHGGMTGPLEVRVFQSENHLVLFYPLYLVERWVRNGSFCDAVYYFNVDFRDGNYRHFWLYNDGVYGRIWYDGPVYEYLLSVSEHIFGGGRKLPPRWNVEVETNLSARITNGILHLVLREPIDPLATNYSVSVGSRSLESPVGSGSGSDATHSKFDEERLIAIKTAGFEMLFTKGSNGVVNTNIIFFPYGETTETNVLGWRIVGNYK